MSKTQPQSPSRWNSAAAEDPAWVRRLFIGITVLFLTLFILLPAINVFAQALSNGWDYYIHTFYAPQPTGVRPFATDFYTEVPDDQQKAHAAYVAADAPWKEYENAQINRGAIKRTLTVVAVVVPLNAIFGLAAAWLVTRFKFRGRALLISLIDLPFSVSPVVSGLIFVLIFGLHGILPVSGVINTQLAVIIATAFVTFPFIARTLIPVMSAGGSDEEVAALSLGANGWQMFSRVTIPNVKWGLFYGLILCTARTCGEFGAAAVVGPKITEGHTMPLRISDLWDGSNIPGAFALSSVLTLLAVGTLAAKTFIEWRMLRVNRTPVKQNAAPGS